MNRFRNKIHLVSVLLLFLLLSTGEWSQASASNDPLVQLQKSIDEILLILKSEELRAPDKKAERKKRILEVVNGMFDFRAMARSSLGPNWNKITAEERDRFVGLFASLIEQRYIGKIDAFDNQKVVYEDKRIKNNKARIYTILIDKDLEIPIHYSLAMNKDKWLVIDLKIENVSLIANYRRDFNSIIRKEQYAGLVKKITDQLEKFEKQN